MACSARDKNLDLLGLVQQVCGSSSTERMNSMQFNDFTRRLLSSITRAEEELVVSQFRELNSDRVFIQVPLLVRYIQDMQEAKDIIKKFFIEVLKHITHKKITLDKYIEDHDVSKLGYVSYTYLQNMLKQVGISLDSKQMDKAFMIINDFELDMNISKMQFINSFGKETQGVKIDPSDSPTAKAVVVDEKIKEVSKTLKNIKDQIMARNLPSVRAHLEKSGKIVDGLIKNQDYQMSIRQLLP